MKNNGELLALSTYIILLCVVHVYLSVHTPLALSLKGVNGTMTKRKGGFFTYRHVLASEEFDKTNY